MVISNSCDLSSYSFYELQDAFNELIVDFETMNSKCKKRIYKLNVENEFSTKMKIELEKNVGDLKLEIDDLKKKILICITHFLYFTWHNKNSKSFI